MAVPTIVSITPPLVFTGGRSLIEILGTNFRVAPIPTPPTWGPATPAAPSVDVYFDTEPALWVGVVSTTRLLVKIPPSPLPVEAPDYGEGSVDVRVRNLDDDGLPITGEVVTKADGLAFQRVQLATQADLTRLVRELLHLMKREIIPNVSHTAHTEFDGDPSSLVHVPELATLPGLAFSGPTLQENRSFSMNEEVWSDPISSEVLARRVPLTVDCLFSLLGVSDAKTESLNLMDVVTKFFERNKYVELQRDPANASLGKVSYELAFQADGLPRDVSRPNESNIRAFSGSFVVRGFDLEGVTGFPTDATSARTALVDDFDLLFVQSPTEE